MNLSKLFQIQAKLDQRIVEEHNLQGQDLLDKKILALLVELGELANEQRSWKFWSKDQEPRYAIIDTYVHGYDGPGQNTRASIQEFQRQPLLEEYVDCLHFILSIGLELKDKFMLEQLHLQSKEKPIDTTAQFNELFVTTASLYISIDDEYYDNADRQGIYEELFERFLSLGEILGFTWKQIEQAFLEKNKINHERQENGY